MNIFFNSKFVILELVTMIIILNNNNHKFILIGSECNHKLLLNMNLQNKERKVFMKHSEIRLS